MCNKTEYTPTRLYTLYYGSMDTTQPSHFVTGPDPSRPGPTHAQVCCRPKIDLNSRAPLSVLTKLETIRRYATSQTQTL